VLLTGTTSAIAAGAELRRGSHAALREALRELACPLRFAVMGNHDSILGRH